MLEGKRSLYDDFSYSHASVEHSAHRNAYFLPWRAFRPSLSSPGAYLHERRSLVHLPIRHLTPPHLRVQWANTILGLVARSRGPVQLASIRGFTGVRARWNGGLRFLPRGRLYRHHRRFCPVDRQLQAFLADQTPAAEESNAHNRLVPA